MLERTVTVVQNTNAIPKFRILKKYVHKKKGGRGQPREDFQKRLFCARAVSYLCYLWIGEVIQGLLVSVVRVLQVVHHQVTVTQCSPGLAIVLLDGQDALKKLNCLK